MRPILINKKFKIVINPEMNSPIHEISGNTTRRYRVERNTQ